MATKEQIKTQKTTEVEGEKPLFNLKDGVKSELTSDEYDYVINSRTEDAWNKQEYGYIDDRLEGYGDWKAQLDLLYHDIDQGKLDKTGAWYKFVKKVKTDNPKPS